MSSLHRRLVLFSLVSFLPAWTVAQTASSDGVFTLGAVEVLGLRQPPADALPSKLLADQTRELDRRTLATALPLLPGVTLINGGDRNEALISVRGFDSRQVPLFLDGVPVYVPYDGNVDLRRFTTGDLALISVSKGYSSVLYGPNALGGAINVVTRRPQSPFEGELSFFAGETGSLGFDARVGGMRGAWYAQAYVGLDQQDSFSLSSNFRPVATEDGGDRNNSAHRDRKASFKLGFAPNATDEYAVGVSLQRGEKQNPPYAGYDPRQTVRYWRWPAWDKTSVYYVSTTQLAGGYVKPRFYYDTFVNTLAAYDDATYTIQRRGSSFVSYYNDYTWGGSIEGGLAPIAGHTVKAAVHFKRDFHREHNAGQPIVHLSDDTGSLGLEDTWQLRPELSLTGGVSFERRKSTQAQTLVGTTLSEFPGNDNFSTNPEVGLFYTPVPNAGTWHLTVARKTRFPTLKDRYSYRMGQALPNPNLRPERALHYELGYDATLPMNLHLRAAAFLSPLRDAIIQVNNVALSATGVSLFQLQNASRAENRGVELSLDQKTNDWLRWSASYTWLRRENESNPSVRFTDTPQHRVLAQVELRPWKRLTVTPAFEYATDRYSTSYGVTAAGYANTDLHARLELAPKLDLRAGVTNLFDRNYALREGYPEPGRTYFARLDWKF